MTSATSRLSRVIFTSILACTAAAPALAGGPAFLKLGGVEGETAGKDNHKDQIEILSYSFGHSQGATSGYGGGMGGGKVSTRDFTFAKDPQAAKESGEKGGTEDINIGVGELQESAAAERKRPGKVKYGDITMKRGTSEAAGGVSVAAGDVDGDGAVTEKRQHGWVTVSKPLERGAVRVKVKFPWAGCQVGARYPSLEIGGDGQRYLLQDVTVASCSTSGDADDRPTEEVAFYYNKIAFNY